MLLDAIQLVTGRAVNTSQQKQRVFCHGVVRIVYISDTGECELCAFLTRGVQIMACANYAMVCANYERLPYYVQIMPWLPWCVQIMPWCVRILQ